MKKYLFIVYLAVITPIIMAGCSSFFNNEDDIAPVYSGKLEKEQLAEPSGNYKCLRIPGIIITPNNTILVYYESRYSWQDYAKIDIIEYRSTDFGTTLTKQILAKGTDAYPTVNNPIMIACKNHEVLFFYSENYTVADGNLKMRKSYDDGLSWQDSVTITDYASPESHDAFALVPGHGILSSSGVLIIPCWYVQKGTGETTTAHEPSVISVFYSLDTGNSWTLADTLKYNTDVTNPSECSIVECSDHRFYDNIRNYKSGYRAIA